MDIDRVLKNPRLVRAILGVSAKEFASLLTTFTAVWRKEAESKKRERRVGGGRIGRIKSPRNKLFFILWYLKVYPTYDVAAYVFSSSKTKTHVWVRDILPLLKKTLGREIVLPTRRISTREEFFATFPAMKEVMVDGLERPTLRSKKDKTQGKHYSGKKKRHMRKAVIVTDGEKRILALTSTKHGRAHDKKLFDKANLYIPEEVAIIADTGFQGLQRRHPNTLLPKKKPRGGFLTDVEKMMNRLISSCRMPVEHAIGGLKRFGAASHIFRNRRGQDDDFLLCAAGLWNFHLRMA
jgi:hypothetical protein